MLLGRSHTGEAFTRAEGLATRVRTVHEWYLAKKRRKNHTNYTEHPQGTRSRRDRHTSRVSRSDAIRNSTRRMTRAPWSSLLGFSMSSVVESDFQRRAGILLVSAQWYVSRNISVISNPGFSSLVSSPFEFPGRDHSLPQSTDRTVCSARTANAT